MASHRRRTAIDDNRRVLLGMADNAPCRRPAYFQLVPALWTLTKRKLPRCFPSPTGTAAVSTSHLAGLMIIE